MVQNKNNILDAGQNKFVPDVIMLHKKNQIDTVIWDFIESDKKSWETEIMDPITFETKKIIKINPNYVEPSEKYKNFKKVFFTDGRVKMEYHQYGSCMDDLKFVCKKFGSYQDILDYMGIIPFSPSIMINISPNWKKNTYIWHKKEALKYAMEKYLNACHRYDRWKCVIECGSGGDFVHAHAVAHINPAVENSVKTHINKGNHKYEIGKHIGEWFRGYIASNLAPTNFKQMFEKDLNIEKGIEGLLKGKFSCQRIMLNNEEITNDKLDYLIEEKKPEGHKNMAVDGFPLLFTSKDITENREIN